jgi:hypothetical protein
VSCETSLRDANWTFGASLALNDKGLFSIGQLGKGMQLMGLIMLYLEWLVLFFNKSCGEELLVVAQSSLLQLESSRELLKTTTCITKLA